MCFYPVHQYWPRSDYVLSHHVSNRAIFLRVVNLKIQFLNRKVAIRKMIDIGSFGLFPSETAAFFETLFSLVFELRVIGSILLIPAPLPPLFVIWELRYRNWSTTLFSFSLY